MTNAMPIKANETAAERMAGKKDLIINKQNRSGTLRFLKSSLLFG
jgi:hypothetical protein